MQDKTDVNAYCWNCEYLMFSDCYGECVKCHLPGVVQPWDSCEHFERRRPENKHSDLHTEH